MEKIDTEVRVNFYKMISAILLVFVVVISIRLHGECIQSDFWRNQYIHYYGKFKESTNPISDKDSRRS